MIAMFTCRSDTKYTDAHGYTPVLQSTITVLKRTRT